MTHEPPSLAPLVEPPDRRPGGRGRIVLAGVFCACAAGVGLGLWARPAPEPRVAAKAAPAPPAPILQIVVDDTPAPIGAPMEVLPADVGPPKPFSAPGLEPAAPRRPAYGLVRVDAPVAAEPAPKPVAPPKVEKPKVEKPKLAKPKAVKVQAPKPKAERPKLVKVKAVKSAAPKPKAVKATPAKPKVAKVARVEKAGTPPRRLAPPPPALKPPPRKSPPKAAPAPRGEGPMRVARATPCASADPGEAMVCADRRLGARERQLQRAWRDAEAAGVPASALNRQHARWLQARAAAAREAPWAVEDVYVARISELNDLTRDARDN